MAIQLDPFLHDVCNQSTHQILHKKQTEKGPPKKSDWKINFIIQWPKRTEKDDPIYKTSQTNKN